MKKYLLLIFLVFSFPKILSASLPNTDIDDSIINTINENKMTYFYGIMYSGKSYTLMETYEKLNSNDSNIVLAFAPKRDTISSEGEIKSRDMPGYSLPALPISDGENICHTIEESLKTNLGKHMYILFDEAQFISIDILNTLWTFIRPLENINACFFGLLVDVFDNFFPGSKWFYEKQDNPYIAFLSIESRALCPCGARAEYSIRLDFEGNVVLSGEQTVLEGAARYDVRCKNHRYEGDNWKNH